MKVNDFYIDPIPPGMKAAMESIRRYEEIMRPAIEAAEIAQSALAGLQPVLKWYENNSYITAATQAITLTSASQAAAIANSISAIQYDPITQALQSAINSPIAQWLDSFNYSPIYTFLDTLSSAFDVSIEKDLYARHYREQMYFARWFPYAGSVLNASYVEQINQVWAHTREGSRNRVKQTDKVVFSFYDNKEIEFIRKSWIDLNLPKFLLRILNQAVRAYYRGEYAMTVCSLATLWEGIISEKSNDSTYRVARKTKENLEKLVEENGYDAIFYSFCDNFIFYNCKSPDEVKEDVPGRHGIAHCWYNKYPTKKAALNAILFTDFLLNLQPAEKEEEYDG